MIRAVFFDAGGVLMNVNKFEVPETARKLGVNEKRFMKIADKYTDACDSGKMSDAEFLGKFSDEFGIERKTFRKKWLKIYEGWAERIPAVYKITFALKRAGYKVGVVSNTKKMFTPFNNRKKIYNDFSPVVLSYRVRLLKPDKKIFALACRRARVRQSEAVFIDDRIVNIKGGRTFGMKAILYKNPAQLKKDLRGLKLNF